MPAEIRRAVLVEAGHRCAIPTCHYPSAEVHHIIPWENCQSHDFENLIALCPNCHRRADAGEIDRKSLRLYKAQLSAALGGICLSAKTSETISEVVLGIPGYEFEFQFPLFESGDLKPVSLFFESWGNQILQEHRADYSFTDPKEFDPINGHYDTTSTTSAAYELIRHDEVVLSIKYQVNRYYAGAAHGRGETVTRTYIRNPLMLLSLNQVFATREYSGLLSEVSRELLLEDKARDKEWVYQGTDPAKQSFHSFNITKTGILLTFDEYQVACYAAGPQVIEIPISRIARDINPRARRLWPQKAF